MTGEHAGNSAAPDSGAAFFLGQYHLNIRIPPTKLTRPMAERMRTSGMTCPSPTPSLKMLRMLSASMVRGSFWMTGMAQN